MSDCILWTGSIISSGYGNKYVAGRGMVLAHRLAYEAAIGPIPGGLEIDHLCRVKLCVNPDHLEAVTHQENVRRAIADVCRRGHIIDETNHYTNPKSGMRRCRICKQDYEREAGRRRRAAKREAA